MLITVEDSQNRAEIKLKRAVEEVKKLLVPAVSHVFTLLPFSLITVHVFIRTPSLRKMSKWQKHMDLVQQTRLVGFS